MGLGTQWGHNKCLLVDCFSEADLSLLSSTLSSIHSVFYPFIHLPSNSSHYTSNSFLSPILYSYAHPASQPLTSLHLCVHSSIHPSNWIWSIFLRLTALLSTCSFIHPVFHLSVPLLSFSLFLIFPPSLHSFLLPLILHFKIHPSSIHLCSIQYPLVFYHPSIHPSLPLSHFLYSSLSPSFFSSIIHASLKHVRPCGSCHG